MKHLVIGICLCFIWSCSKETSTKVDLANYIPQDAAITFSIKDLAVFSSNLENNDLIKNNTNHHFYISLKQNLQLLKYLHTDEEVLISFKEKDKEDLSFILVTPQKKSIFNLDSLSNAMTSKISYNKNSFNKTTADGNTLFSIVIDSVFIASDSQLTIEEIIRNKETRFQNKDISTFLSTTTSDESVLLNHANLNSIIKGYLPDWNTNLVKQAADISALDIDLFQNRVELNGVSKSTDSIFSIIDLFKDTKPQKTTIANVTPLSATGFYTFTYSDFSTLRQNLEFYHSENRVLPTLKNTEILNIAKEIGVIYLNSEHLLYLNTIDYESLSQSAMLQQEAYTAYRDVSIYKMNKPTLFKEAFNPLVTQDNFNFYTRVDSALVFSKTLEGLEMLIANYQNNSVLAKQDFYDDLMQSLSDESSLLMVANLDMLKNSLGSYVSDENAEDWNKLKLKDHKLAGIQFIYERDFAHVHAVIEQVGSKSTATGISQIASVTLDEAVRSIPILFTNHTNGTKDIIAQGEENTLFLLSNKGNLRWKKQLDSPILGTINEVDLFKNGKIQMAFATANTVHVLDRNGKNVAPFPLSFKDEITQPLSVFDYDGNKRYRFLVTQGSTVKMYNKEGKTVSGFTFNNAKDSIVRQPKHIRIGSKDYILIMSASGKLFVLSRTGKERVATDYKLSLSNNEWYKYNNSFATTTQKGELIKISESGKTTTTALNLPQDHYITTTNKTLVTLAGNSLTIKGKTIELDFGLYTEPKIFYIDNKIYVSVTDTQAHKVYLFDSNGILRPNFPVYGNSAIDLGHIDNDKILELIVQGEEDSILIYKIN